MAVHVDILQAGPLIVFPMLIEDYGNGMYSVYFLYVLESAYITERGSISVAIWEFVSMS